MITIFTSTFGQTCYYCPSSSEQSTFMVPGWFFIFHVENILKLCFGPTIQSRPCRPKAGFGLVDKNVIFYLHSIPTKSCSHSGRLRLLQQAHDHLVVITSITITTITTTRQLQKQSHWQQHGKETEAGPDKWCWVAQSWRR